MENRKVPVKIFEYLKEVLKLFKSLVLPYQIGFVRGHYYLNSDQISQIKQVLNSSGSKDIVSEYEKRMASLIGPGYGMSFAAGRMAFYCLLKSLNVGPGDEVILPAFTCSVMPNAVLRVGATPIFSNVEPKTFGSSPSAITEKINSHTKVIVAQHSFGIPCKIKEIMHIAKPKGIFVVEDSALTLGSTVDGVATGNFGHAAIFSTDHSKPLNTVVGGYLYTTNMKLLNNVRSKVSEIPDLDKEHQTRLFKQLLFEQKWYYPLRYPKLRLINMLTSLRRKLQKKENMPTFLEGDYTKPEAGQLAYPYPARLPSFLAQLGIFELEGWEKEKCRRKDILQQYLRIAGNSRISAYIPEVYSDPTIDIVPLRFVYRYSKHNQHREVMSKCVDSDWTWFRSPVTGCLKDPDDLGYHSGSCVLSEQVCSDVINWPCVVPFGWEDRLLKFFNSVVKCEDVIEVEKNYIEYWNDIEKEKEKPFYLENVSDLKLIRFLKDETNLERCFTDALDYANGLGAKAKGMVLDVGAGVAWTSALVSQLPSVQKVVATDYSKHRLFKISPIVCEQLSGNSLKVDRLLGNFLDLKFNDKKFDVIIFCQSLYMFKDLCEVMNKIRSLLVPGGILIVACERITETCSIFSPAFYKRKLRHMLFGRTDTSGNHYYIDREYKNAIKNVGLEYHFQLLEYPVFLDRELMAGNHFGVKR